MGKHFDALVDFANKHLGTGEKAEYIKDVKIYLEDIITRCTLFELPINSRDVFPLIGKEMDEYNRYIIDYFEMSKKYGSSFLRPFDITAVEDKESVVILNKEGNYAILCEKSMNDMNEEQVNVVTGYVDIVPCETGINKLVRVDYIGCCMDGEKRGNIFIDNLKVSKSFANAIHSYAEEVIYISDPENFIIEKESNQSKQMRERKNGNGGKRNKLNKTVMRPHYICLSEIDLREFAKKESKEPRGAHPVRGHVRKLISSKYINMQGQRIYVRQYFTGDGKIEGKNGWNYQVYVKEAPNRIIIYNKV